jgi:hypothetical protein
MLTIKTTDTQHAFIAAIVDAAGATVTGAAGSFVLSCSAAKLGSPVISGSTPITVVGQTPDHLQIAMQS